MKLSVLFLVFIYSVNSVAQKSDTIFLQRTVSNSPYPEYFAIYIDTGAHIKKQLTDFSFSHYDSATYFEQLTSLRPLKYKKTIPANFPRKWIALYQLKGKNYLYSPCDWGYHFRFEITDSTTINYTMEGPEPSRIDQISFPTKTKTIIEGTNYWEGKHVEIKLVDTVKGIAVISFGPTKYRNRWNRVLMVDAKKAYLFPVIVNYCPTSKAHEMDFDTIDFDSLLKQKR